MVFAASGVEFIIVVVLAALALAAIVTYSRTRIRHNPRSLLVFRTVRASLVVLIAVVLLRPQIHVSAALPKTNVVGVLIDDSRSMRLADMQGRTRADVVRTLLGGPDSALYKSLRERFVVRLFHTTGGGNHIERIEDLAFDGTRTKLSTSLDGVRNALAGTSVAGIVLVSDGADNGATPLQETLHTLNTRRIPVYTVGIGQERFDRDIEITQVTTPSTVLKGSSIGMQVDIAHRGFGGKSVQLRVEENGVVVSTQQIELPRDGEATTVRIRASAPTAGAHTYTVGIVPQSGEVVADNNKRTVLVTVRDTRKKILYIEGEPRFEFKFLRHAMQNDDNLQLVAMVRAMKDRFFRFGLDDASQLVDGFPKTREELFQYSGIVIGSIEASYFSVDQMRMISDFVSERGGGLMMLGGRFAFAEGGYAGTPIADVLPVELSDGEYGKPVLQHVKVDVTPAGSIVSATQIAATEQESASRWKTMPPVTSVNRLLRAKSGAAVLMSGVATNMGERTVVMASSRYGRGKSVAFPIQDSWLWQMRSDTPVGDATYASFWRQMLRWLTSDARDRVTTTVPDEPVDIGESMQITAEVADSHYTQAMSASVIAFVRAPSGATQKVPMEWSGTRDGEYHAAFIPTERGLHQIRVEAAFNNETLTSQPTSVEVDTSRIEYFGAEQRPAVLRRIAEETGGRYYTPKTVNGLAQDLVYSEAGTTAFERLDLWDAPIVFLLLLTLICVEWGYRRSKGLI